MHPVTGIERIGRNCRRDFTAIVADPGACRNQGPAKIARTVLASGHQPGSLNTGSRTDSGRFPIVPYKAKGHSRAPTGGPAKSEKLISEISVSPAHYLINDSPDC